MAQSLFNAAEVPEYYVVRPRFTYLASLESFPAAAPESPKNVLRLISAFSSHSRGPYKCRDAMPIVCEIKPRWAWALDATAI